MDFYFFGRLFGQISVILFSVEFSLQRTASSSEDLAFVFTRVEWSLEINYPWIDPSFAYEVFKICVFASKFANISEKAENSHQFFHRITSNLESAWQSLELSFQITHYRPDLFCVHGPWWNYIFVYISPGRKCEISRLRAEKSKSYQLICFYYLTQLLMESSFNSELILSLLYEEILFSVDFI